jgi:hypothetical protein
MYLLKDQVGTVECRADPQAAFTKLLSALQSLGVDIEHANPNTGEVVARCLTVFLNFVLWRCWSDKLLFVLKSDDGIRTIVIIYSLPNLMRYKVHNDEKLTEVDDLIARLAANL